MTYEEAKSRCHIRSAIRRTTFPEKKFWKNHSVSFDERVPEKWKLKDDWEEYDPRDTHYESYA